MRILDNHAEREFCKANSNQLVGENAGLSGVKLPCTAVARSREVEVLGMFIVAIQPIDEQLKGDRAVLSELEYAVHALLEAGAGMPTRSFKVRRITTY